MSGVIEDVLTRRFGSATTGAYQGVEARVWNNADEPRRCRLLVGLEWDPDLSRCHDHLRELYGEPCAGSIFPNKLRISSLAGPSLWGLYRIAQFQSRPEVIRALSIGPAADYFMDAANVWYYGYTDGMLYCYDAENDDIEDLGPAEPAIDGLISQWLDAMSS